MLFNPELTTQIRDWLFEKALPFWAEAGVDQEFGGFVEELAFTGADAGLPHKRVRVTCRQVYVFSHAKLLGWTDGAHLIDRGADYLIKKAWQGDEAGFARRLTREGDILDPTADLYEQAFALFAFAFAYQATQTPDYIQWTHKTADFIEEHLRDKEGEGFWHDSERAGHRLQNPHMHLTEACLAAGDATGDQRFSNLGKELITLFQTRFYNRQAGVLTEFFERDWSAAKGEKGLIVEPGHELEWAWILQNARSRFGTDSAETIRTLVKHAETHGLNSKTGAMMNSIAPDGRPIDAGSRSWPTTERIKAAVALYELDGDDPSAVVEEASRLLFERYLSSAPGVIEIPEGTWIDAFDGEARPVSERIPASLLYHFFLAFVEILRLQDNPRAPTSATTPLRRP